MLYIVVVSSLNQQVNILLTYNQGYKLDNSGLYFNRFCWKFYRNEKKDKTIYFMIFKNKKIEINQYFFFRS